MSGVLKIWAALFCIATFPITLGLSSTTTSRSSSSKEIQIPVGKIREKAVVVGGGPVGLAAAITLANRGYDVSVFEASSSEKIYTFDPAVAYLYNVNTRGQVFTKRFPNIHQKLVDRSISSLQTRFVFAPGDVTKELTFPNFSNSFDEVSFCVF